MKLLRDDDLRFKALRLKTLGFLFAALLGAVAATLLFAWRQGQFEPKTPLIFISDTGTDLSVGMAVKFSGFKIGSVTQLQLDDRGRVVISVLIEDRYMKWLKPDSVGRVGKEGLIGDAYIDVGVGDPRKLPVEANAELEFMPARSMDEMLREFHDRVMPVVDEVAIQAKRLNDPNGDLNRSLANLRVFSENLKTTQAKLDHVNQLTGSDIPATLTATRDALQHASASLVIVEKRLPELIDRTDRTLGHVEATGRETQQLIEGISPDVVGVVQDSRDLVHKGNEVVDGVTQHWPLSGMVARPEVQPERGDSQGSPR